MLIKSLVRREMKGELFLDHRSFGSKALSGEGSGHLFSEASWCGLPGHSTDDGREMPKLGALPQGPVVVPVHSRALNGEDEFNR